MKQPQPPTLTVHSSPPSPSLFRSALGCALLIAVGSVVLSAELPSSGIVEGRVLNAASGNYLHNARVVAQDTLLEASTNENGEYRIVGVPSGTATIRVGHTGLVSQTKSIVVAPGRAARLDFDLVLAGTAPDSSKIVKLAAFTVQERELTGQAVALHEQRTAPNIKNVVAIDFDTGEGNVAEFLKYTPGIVMDQNPQTPTSAQIRGMPASGTLVMTNGMEVALSSIGTRDTSLALAPAGNIDRIEVTKVPTPDMPANAVGGSINMITKSGFSRRTPLLTYNVFATLSTLDGLSGPGQVLARSHGPDPHSHVPRVNPSFNLSYLLPVNKSFAVALSGTRTSRYNDWEFPQPAWDKIALRLINNISNTLLVGEDKELATVTFDWKPGDRNFLSLGYSHSNQQFFVRQNRIVTTFGTGSTGGPTFAQGANTAVGNVAMAPVGNNQYKALDYLTLSHRFTGAHWKVDSNVSWSKADFRIVDIEDGFFNNVTARVSNVAVRQEGIDRMVDRRVPVTSATDRTGAAVDVNDANNHTLASVGSSPQEGLDEVTRAAINVTRDFNFGFGLTLKAGALITRRKNDTIAGAKTWTFTPPAGSSALVRNYDLIATNFSARSHFTDANGQDVRANFISQSKAYDLFVAHPAWFVLNETAAHTSAVTLTKTIEETISAGYLRSDLDFLDHRLRLVAGVRFERTDDEGWGPLNDIRNTYVRDAKGNLVRDAAGRLVPITTDALKRTQLQYQLKGMRTQRDYAGYYPSVNTSYSIQPDLILRAAYAKTIGRPNFPEIIPGITITDPDSTAANRVITVVNSGLKPWSADNFDLSLELYEVKGAVASASLFRKDLKNFFGGTRAAATRETLAEFGLPDDYLDYDIVTKRNMGDATISGTEFSYRQALGALTPWAKGFQIFGNVTLMDLGGRNADDLVGFSPRTVQWGVSYARPRFSARVNINETKWRRMAAAAASATVRPNSYLYYAPQVKVDATVSYMINRRFSIYADARNLSGTPLRRGTWSPDTPVYARVDLHQYPSASFTLGLRGEY